VAAGVVALPLALAFGVASGLGPGGGPLRRHCNRHRRGGVWGTPVQITGPTRPMTLVVACLVATDPLPSGAV